MIQLMLKIVTEKKNVFRGTFFIRGKPESWRGKSLEMKRSGRVKAIL